MLLSVLCVKKMVGGCQLASAVICCGKMREEKYSRGWNLLFVGRLSGKGSVQRSNQIYMAGGLTEDALPSDIVRQGGVSALPSKGWVGVGNIFDNDF